MAAQGNSDSVKFLSRICVSNQIWGNGSDLMSEVPGTPSPPWLASNRNSKTAPSPHLTPLGTEGAGGSSLVLSIQDGGPV